MVKLWLGAKSECPACERVTGRNPVSGLRAVHNAGTKEGNKSGPVAYQPIDARDRCPGSNEQ